MASSRLALRLAGLRADRGYGFPGVYDPVARLRRLRREPGTGPA
ncbi:hypothetical protein QYS46_12910 [Klebsiella michiganensis]|nr:hypothetical protein CSC12_5857 [Klebsiella michiganensis]MDS6631362.1 hypothetical protein [Klebsiella michiganensis]